MTRPLRRELRRLAAGWLLLLALLATSLGSAYVPLHGANAAVGIGIAAVKAGIVAWLFMRLESASGLLRLTAALALGAALLLGALGGVDYATRVQLPSAVQQPQQVPAFSGAGH